MSYPKSPPKDTCQKYSGIKDWQAVLFLVALFSAFYAPMLGAGKMVLGFKDIARFNYPMHKYLHGAYQEGFIPWWDPGIFSGAPFFAELQTEVFYPLSLIYLIDSFPVAFTANFVLHHFLLAISVYGLTRYWNHSVLASLVSALVSCLGGYFLSITSLISHFHATAWVPLVILCFEKWIVKKSKALMLLAVVVLSIQTLAGSPETSVLTVLLVAAYVAVVLRDDRSVFRRGLLVAGAVLLSLGLTAFQLMATASLVQESVRAGGMTFDAHAHWSLNPSHLFSLIFPYDILRMTQANQSFPDTLIASLNMGIIPLAFSILAIIVLRDRKAWFWAVMFCAGLFLSLGKYNPLYEYVFNIVPMLDRFQYPEKYFFLTAFAMVFLSAHVFDALMEKTVPRKEKGPLWVVIIFFGISMVLSIYAPPGHSRMTLLFLGVFILLLFLLHGRRLSRQAGRFILIALILMDLVSHNSFLINLVDREYFISPPPIAREIKKDSRFYSYRIFSDPRMGFEWRGMLDEIPQNMTSITSEDMKNFLLPNMANTYDLNLMPGLLGLGLKLEEIWRAVFAHASLPEKIRLLERSNVRYVITTEGMIPEEGGIRLKPKEELIKLDDPLERVFLVPDARVVGENAILKHLLSKSFDPHSEVLVSEPVGMTRTEAYAGKVIAATYQPNRINVTLEQNGYGFLINLDSYFPGWQAWVNGQKKEIIRANYFFRAVLLPPGRHEVEFVYEPKGLRKGLGLSAIALLVMLIAFVKGAPGGMRGVGRALCAVKGRHRSDKAPRCARPYIHA